MAEATAEQRAAIEHIGNCVITARPGSGKTFCVVQKINQIQKTLPSYQGVVAISFTNKASDELLDRCRRAGVATNTSFFGTIDKFCLTEIVFKFGAHLEPAFNVRDFVEKFDDDRARFKILESEDLMSNIEERKLICEVLRSGVISLACIGRCAFVLMRELPECQKYLTSRYAWIFIDEYQDCGVYQHRIFRAMVEFGINGCAVGDIDQAIYGFSGKSEKYLVDLANDSVFAHFEITQNWRCDKAITAYSLKYLGIDVAPVASSDRRVFEIGIDGDESAITSCLRKYIPLICEKYAVDDASEVAILASSNITLDRIASEIGMPFRRYKETPLDRSFSKHCLLWRDLLFMLLGGVPYAGDFVASYYGFNDSRERARLFETVEKLANLQTDEYLSHSNLFESVSRVCLRANPDVEDSAILIKTLEAPSLLEDAYREKIGGYVNILTYHKAKGLEFDVVFCLELYKHILPRYGYTEIDEKQAVNMFYVGVTRARKACYIPVGTSRHNSMGEIKIAIPSPLLTRNGARDLCNRAKWFV